MRFSSHSRLGLFLMLLLVLATGLGLYTSSRGAAQAASPRLQLSQKVGPPTTSMQVNGQGFGHRETVLVDFDTMQIGRINTDATGRFVVQVVVPSSALPGKHTMLARGQTSRQSAQAPFLVRTEWTQFRFEPDHTGNNPYENVLSSSNVSALTLDWRHSIGGWTCSSPSVVNGIVYTGSVNGIYALDALSGALKWSYTTGVGIGSSPAVVNGVVYVGSEDNNLYALDAMTGALKWSYTMGGIGMASPSIANGLVYIGSSNGIYALDALSGALKWSDNLRNSTDSSPAVVNGVVYVGANDDKLYALDAVTGALKWSYTTGNAIASSPAVANGVVYVGSDDGKLYAFHLPGMS